jgi:hypothetical protein
MPAWLTRMSIRPNSSMAARPSRRLPHGTRRRPRQPGPAAPFAEQNATRTRPFQLSRRGGSARSQQPRQRASRPRTGRCPATAGEKRDPPLQSRGQPRAISPDCLCYRCLCSSGEVAWPLWRALQWRVRAALRPHFAQHRPRQIQRQAQFGVDLSLQVSIVDEPCRYCPGPVMAAEQVEFEAVRSAQLPWRTDRSGFRVGIKYLALGTPYRT